MAPWYLSSIDAMYYIMDLGKGTAETVAVEISGV
jgi:hypothetical protein